MNKHIKEFITCLVLVALLGMISPLLLAQQNQSAQKADTEIEALKKRVSEIEKQLQTVENVENLDLQAKLAEANTKLADAEFGKFERGLKDSNDERMRNWIIFFVAIVSTAGVAFWFVVKSLIADRVEKNLNGFKEAVKAQDVIKNQLEVLEKQYATSILGNFIRVRLDEEHHHPEQIKAFRNEILLELFADKRHDIVFRYRMAEILAARKSPQLVSPALELLNSVVDSDLDIAILKCNH